MPTLLSEQLFPGSFSGFEAPFHFSLVCPNLAIPTSAASYRRAADAGGRASFGAARGASPANGKLTISFSPGRLTAKFCFKPEINPKSAKTLHRGWTQRLSKAFQCRRHVCRHDLGFLEEPAAALPELKQRTATSTLAA